MLAKAGHSEIFEIPVFRVALPPEADQPKAEAIASLPGMTIELFNEFLRHHISLQRKFSQLIFATPL
jgi:hypothetical protein